jgi:nucleotide-binding universal stress UspA family protein
MILLPLDGSALSESAVPYAEAIARAGGARIALVRVAVVRALPGADPADGQLRAIEEARAYLSEHAERLSARGFAVEFAVACGDPAELILAEQHIRNADLIVMATHGRTGLRRAIFGSVADGVVRRADAPVFLVPAGAGPFPIADRGLRMLIPLDGSERSEEILPVAAGLADAFGATMLLLESARPEPPASNPVEARNQLLRVGTIATEHAIDGARDHLERIAVGLRAGAREVEVHAVTGPPGPTIVAEARAQRADVVAMSTHGRGGLARLVLGSVAEHVLREGGLPMLVARPRALREAATPPREAVLIG